MIKPKPSKLRKRVYYGYIEKDFDFYEGTLVLHSSVFATKEKFLELYPGEKVVKSKITIEQIGNEE